MRASVRSILELARRFFRLLEDDARHLAGKAGDAETRRLDDLDPLDVARRGALELVDRPARLVGDALAVDQDILGRLAEAARARVHALDRESRHLDEHVVG